MRFIDIILHEFRIDMPADGEGMGIPRKKMPQIKTKDYPEYFKYLKDNGVHFQKLDSVKAATLKPTQSEFSKQGVEKQLQKMWDKNDGDKPLIASSDDYIIDGHHRWLVAKNTRRPLTIFKADVPMKELMALTLKFPKVYFKDIYNEGYKLQLERDADMYVLHITDNDTGKRTEVRGKSGYESGNYDADDKLHQLLDRIGKASNISDLINGEVVGINPKHPDGKNAKAHADVAFNEETGAEMLKIFRTMHHDTAKNKEMDAFIKSHEWKLADFTPDMFPSEEEFFDYDDPFNRVIDIDYYHRVDLSQPIIVGPQYSDGKYSVIDGNHRAAKAQQLGKTIKGYFPVKKVNETAGVGRIVKGVNTTVDVGPNEIIKQVKKFGNDVDRDGFPKKHLR